ncbi:hypothetical protein [Thermococcus paralvinellae]|uniref:Uncharacterized protein n=1 Tax=Thermococcus paralvinellae TaxID=582419 RepID=W0I7V0_9EURY|nr:hypothetical protein [Thermococcus paralvinellae]AHF80530.1 Hypothetical protein TES1_1146 [Thermococcus paralvinellae]
MKVLSITLSSKLSSFLRRKLVKAVEEFSNKIEAEENLIILPKKEKAEFGTFLCSSSIIAGKHIGRTYYEGLIFSTSRRFEREAEITAKELLLEPKEYRVEVDVNGAGTLKLPGFRLENGILILYILPKYIFEFSQENLTLATQEDYAQITFSPLEYGFRGEVSLSLNKAKEVRVLLKGNKAEEFLFWDNESGSFTYNFIDEPLVIISHEKLITPKEFARSLGKVSIISGHGEFGIVGEMVLPLKKEVRESIKLAVTF